MCGIAGIWHRSGQPVDPLALERMSTMLVHRGPDGSGARVEGEIGLASRRLRILDLSPAGDQPMSLPDGSLWITFNGEIHNYLELRRALESQGVTFRTHTDTEVILWAYATWGSNCFERFNGMWGLALWDARERHLVLSRDRLGIKPILYSVRGERVCFASEAKAVLAAFPEERQPDAGEIDHFLAGGYPDASEATFFENVKLVAPGTCMVFSATGVRTASYWSFRPGDDSPKPEAEARFRELLADSVALRTRSDVPVGACLSGGLDSSSVVALLAPLSAQPVHCFSTRYVGKSSAYDESRYAALAARARNVTMHWVEPDPREMLGTIRKIVWHHDAPMPMRGRLAQWFVMQQASRHVKVLVDGQGSDELLAGYSQDAVFYLWDLWHREPRSATWARHCLREASDLGQVEGSRKWFALNVRRRWRNDARADGERPFASALNNVLWNGVRRHGLPELLHGADALSMAFSLESRPPFLDHRLVEFCFSLPFSEKVSDGWTKSLLRRAMAGVVPAPVLARRNKFGFGAPLVPWLLLEHNWREVRELLLSPRSRGRGVLDPRRVERTLTAFPLAPSLYTSQRAIGLWRWITMELWFRDFIDGAGVAGATAGA